MSGTDCFEIERVLELFKKCRPDGDQVIIDGYVDAYEDLCKLFPLLGTVFGFVTSDVNEKIGILRDYRKSPDASHYETITNMINYEVENNLTEKKHKPLSGARTLLRLHRALQFVIEFMRAITTMDLSKKLTTVASEAYHKTLANHHPWVIKKAVGMAMYTLPTGEHLISKMGSKDAPQIRETMGEVITLAQGVYDHTETLYTTNNLLNLP